MQNSKTNTILLVVLIILVIGFGTYLIDNKKSDRLDVQIYDKTYEKDSADSNVKDTYIYTNHGFSIELPKQYIPKQFDETNGSNASYIIFKGAYLDYSGRASWWEKNKLTEYTYIKDQKIGETIFKIYLWDNGTHYWFKKGEVGYDFLAIDESKNEFEKLLATFKFIGWPQIEGNKENLMSFSIKPGQEVSGVFKATGVLSGGYFFEGNLPVSILDENKKLTSYGPGHGQATTDWMTSGSVSFEIDFDFNNIPKGKYYIKLMQDDPSGGANGFVPRFVLIPIIVK